LSLSPASPRKGLSQEGISSVKRFLEGVKTYPLMKDKFWESLLDELKPGDKEFVIASIPHEDVDVEVLSRSLLLESSNVCLTLRCI
jgi:hypothetical protein